MTSRAIPPLFGRRSTTFVLMSDEPKVVNIHHSINYIELPATDLAATKSFYGAVFGWEFRDPNGNELAVWSA